MERIVLRLSQAGALNQFSFLLFSALSAVSSSFVDVGTLHSLKNHRDND